MRKKTTRARNLSALLLGVFCTRSYAYVPQQCPKVIGQRSQRHDSMGCRFRKNVNRGSGATVYDKRQRYNDHFSLCSRPNDEIDEEPFKWTYLPPFNAQFCKILGAAGAGIFIGAAGILGLDSFAGGADSEVQRALELVQEVLVALDRQYVDPTVDVESLAQKGLAAALQTLDPYSEIEDANSAAEMRESVAGRYAGVGLIIAGDRFPGAGVVPEMLTPETAPGLGPLTLPDGALGDGASLQRRGASDSAIGGDGGVPSSGRDIDSVKKGTAGKAAAGKRQRQGVTVVSAFEGYAFDAGLRVGDRILAVDGKTTTGVPVDAVRDMLRGEPGTEVTVKVERDAAPAAPFPGRPAAGNTFEAVLTRRLVRLRDTKLATFAGAPEDGIAYIKLSGFSQDAGRDVLAQFTSLMAQAPKGVKALLLDLRGNPGGLLESAVDVSALLVPKGSTIVSARGRESFGSVLYRSGQDPMLEPGMRLAVLTDGGTASAAEIVSGAVQDTDAGVIVGFGDGGTYGKGLIQSVSELPSSKALKFTVGRYYTPSGRCIQSVNYNGGAKSDDLEAVGDKNKRPPPPREEGDPAFRANKVADADRRTFRTVGGRFVRDGGGVDADVSVKARKPSALEVALAVQGAYFDYAGQWAKTHTFSGIEVVDAATLRDFRRFVADKQKQGEYSLEVLYQRQLTKLQETFADTGLKGAETQVKPLTDAIVREMTVDFDRRSGEIKTQLENAILARYLPESMLLEHNLKTDEQVWRAVEVVRGDAYEAILRPHPRDSAPALEAGPEAVGPLQAA